MCYEFEDPKQRANAIKLANEVKPSPERFKKKFWKVVKKHKRRHTSFLEKSNAFSRLAERFEREKQPKNKLFKLINILKWSAKIESQQNVTMASSFSSFSNGLECEIFCFDWSERNFSGRDANVVDIPNIFTLKLSGNWISFRSSM